MSFSPLARFRNYTVKNLKALLEVYPDMATEPGWGEAGDFAEASMEGYKKTAAQQGCQFGVEDRSQKNRFRIQTYLYTFEDENLERFVRFWMKTYFAPNPYVKSSGEEPFLIYCELAKEILESEEHVVDYDAFFEQRIGGGSRDILLNSLKNYAAPLIWKPEQGRNLFGIDVEDLAALAEEVTFIESEFPIGDAKDKSAFFERYSYANFCKFYRIQSAFPGIGDGIMMDIEDLSDETAGDVDHIGRGWNAYRMDEAGTWRAEPDTDAPGRQTDADTDERGAGVPGRQTDADTNVPGRRPDADTDERGADVPGRRPDADTDERGADGSGGEQENGGSSRIRIWREELPGPEAGPRVTGGENVLLYGVPGAGKSHMIRTGYCSDPRYIERVVFHPDYTYSDFVGQVLPHVEGKRVTYRFTPGPFTRLLYAAWNDPLHAYYLVIEEINRGNAPAVFGEIFQLLDRRRAGHCPEGTAGESEYGIANYDVARIVYGDEMHEVRIPSNMHVLATMNTSDQNVFALDTAFQRRFHLRHIRNRVAEASHAGTLIEGTLVSWGAFAAEINRRLTEADSYVVSSEDRRLGAYFVTEEELYAEPFSEKVLKFLWDDAFQMDRGAVFQERFLALEQVIETYQECAGDRLEEVLRADVYRGMRERMQGES